MHQALGTSTRSRLALMSVGILLALGAARSASADDELARIDSLLAGNRVDEALPVAVTRARRLGTDQEAWRKVLTISGWASSTETATEALAHLVELSPSDVQARLSLTQQLLWSKRTAEALPHARWLLAEGGTHTPQAWEVITWVLVDQKQTDEAREALGRWIALAPLNPQPRWILADLTHWTVHWRQAVEQYSVLADMPSEAAKANLRVSMIRHAHPDEVHLDLTAWSDNFDVSYKSMSVGTTSQLPSRFVLMLRTEAGEWGQTKRTRDGSEHLRVIDLTGRLRYEQWNGLWPEVFGGFEGDSEQHVAPTGGAGVGLSLAGQLFGRVQFEHDRHRVSLDAARADIQATGAAWLLYWEASRWLFASTEGALHYISDHNVRTRALLMTGVHNPDRWQLEPRVFVQVDEYRDKRPVALPYFTPTERWIYGSDLVARYAGGAPLLVEAQIGFVVQGDTVALRPGGLVRLELAEQLRAAVGVAYIGSPQYNQTRLDASLGYLF